MNSQHRYRALWGLAAGVALAFFASSPLAAQETGVVEGTVTGPQGQAIAGAQVSLVGTQRGTITASDGTYRITGVPAGTREVRVQRIGYRGETQQVQVAAGATVAVNFTMIQAVVDVQEVVVTGVGAATARARLPFTVDQITAEALPVPAVSAGGAIQGKIAGAQVVAGSGRPGAAPSILLRGPTSINAAGRGQGPMVIVDGVILGASLADIDALDIENIEVVKGAAAASLYGSRAAAGVINITTRTGQRLGDDQVRFSLRSELGQSSLESPQPLTQHHHYRLSGNPERPFLSADGVEFQLGDRRPNNTLYVPTLAGATIWDTYQNQPWPDGPYDHVGTFFENGVFQQHQISATGRTGATNFHAAVALVDEDGVIWNQPGYTRQSFRLNVDQGMGDNLQLSARTYFSRSDSGLFPEASGNPLFNLTRMPAGVDLTRRDDRGEYIILPMPGQENPNPLEELSKREYTDERDRFLGSANVRWSPLDWLDLDANASYDRANQRYEDFYPVGFQTARATPALNQGNIFRAGTRTDALNTSLTASTRHSFGALDTRLQGRYLYEAQDYDYFEATGYHFPVRGIRTLQAATQGRQNWSQVTSIRSEGYFGILNLDYAGRYIADMLVRRDGSSLFGEDQRWQTYYRLAGAYRLTEEPWWNMPAFDELKLRYSVGTAGGRPNFFAQYETYAVSAQGTVTPQVLGNPDLRPEHVTEHEMGIDAGFLNRFLFAATYARSTAEDQILPVPLPAVSGWVQRWMNAGTLQSNTVELSLDADVLRRGNFHWTSRVLFDRTRQEITRLDVPPFLYGAPIQGLTEVFYAREGEPLGTIYGHRFATSCADLPAGAWANRCDEFAINDDGYLVWVGQGGSLQNPQWGSIHPETVGPDAVWWGTPFATLGEDGTQFQPIGNTQPDFRWSLSNSFNYGGFRLYTLFDAERGVDVYNMPRHWQTFQLYSGEGDQGGVPIDQAKPIGYYANLYRNLTPKNSHFVEDGSFVKLRELSLAYRFTPEQLGTVPFLGNMAGVGLSLTGRNLITWTNYQGYDPEVGVSAGQLGSAALNRFDGFTYPNFRTWTAAVEVNF